MSDLPSRDHFADLIPGDFRTNQYSEYRVLEAYASGRLVDREAIDYEAAAVTMVRPLNVIDIDRHHVRHVIAAAIGDTE